MNRTKRFSLLLLAAMLILSIPVLAVASHAPVLNVVAPFAPRDMKVTIEIKKNIKGEEHVIPVVLEAGRRAWEGQYRLRREAVYGITAWYGNAYDLKDAVLILESGGETKTVPIPAELLSERGSEDHIMLSWRTGRMSALPAWRAPSLLLMWAALAMAVEGVVFWLYGYRSRRSWLMFFLINLVTQTAHHAIVAGLNVDVNRIKVYAISIPVLFLVEMLAFVMLVDERSRDRTIGFAVAANAASQAVLGLLMQFLPA